MPYPLVAISSHSGCPIEWAATSLRSTAQCGHSSWPAHARRPFSEHTASALLRQVKNDAAVSTAVPSMGQHFVMPISKPNTPFQAQAHVMGQALGMGQMALARVPPMRQMTQMPHMNMPAMKSAFTVPVVLVPPHTHG